MTSTTDPRLAKLAEALEMRSARPNTRATYVRCAAKFLAAVGKPIKQVTRSDAEQFLLAQTRDGRVPRTRNIYLASIRWLLRASGRRDVTAQLRQARVSKALRIGKSNCERIGKSNCEKPNGAVDDSSGAGGGEGTEGG